jgi:hypothetical protein
MSRGLDPRGRGRDLYYRQSGRVASLHHSGAYVVNRPREATIVKAINQYSGRGAGRWLLCSVLVLGSALLVAWLLKPNFVREGPAPCRNACINNLRQIAGAKEEWALEHNRKAGDECAPAQVARYIKGGFRKCPGDIRPGQGAGTYIIGKLEEAPRCTVPGHTL